MKLFKKIIPLATVAAAVTAFAVPMASCSGSALLTVSAKNFAPNQHAAVAEGLTQEEATIEYFKDPMNAANDICFYFSSIASLAEVEGVRANIRFENSFSVSVTSFKIGDKKEVEILGTKYVGYMVSCSLKQSYNQNRDKKLDSAEQSKYQKCSESVSESSSMSALNALAFLTPSGLATMPWSMHIYGVKALNENWSASISGNKSTTNTNVWLDGSVDSSSQNTGGAEHKSGKYYNDPEPITEAEGFPSYVFAQVNVKS